MRLTESQIEAILLSPTCNARSIVITAQASSIQAGWTAHGTVISGNPVYDIAPNVALGRTTGIYLMTKPAAK